MKRREFLKFGTVASAGAAGVAALLGALVDKNVYASLDEAKAAFEASPFKVFDEALRLKLPSTSDNVLGRPPAIDIAGMSTGEYQYVPTACWQCVSRCGAVAVKKGDQVLRMEGNPNLPRSNGVLCAKGRSGFQQIYDPDRLLFPMRRRPGTKRGEGKWDRITWDDALSEIVARLKPLRDSGHPELFMFHYGRMKGSSSTIIKDYFLAGFGTKTIGDHTSICEGGKWTAQELTWGGHYDVNDLDHTKFILNFGANVLEAHTSHIAIAQRFIDAVATRKVETYTFDVRMTNTAAKSTRWVPIKPGTDLAVMLAMAHVIVREKLYDEGFINTWTNVTIPELEEHLAGYTPTWAEGVSGVSAALIEELALKFARAKPGTVITYRGAIAHYNGVQTERAAFLLESLCGYLNDKGGRLKAVSAKWKSSFKPAESHGVGLKIVDGKDIAYPTHHVSNQIFTMIKDGKNGRPSVYMTYCHNPAYVNGNCKENIEVLRDESLIPFHIAVDVAYGETTMYADLVLPDTTYLERWDWEDMVSYNGIPEFYIRQPVVAPPKEVRDFKDVAIELAVRLGFPLPFTSAEEFVKDACEATPNVVQAGGFEYMKRYGAWYNRSDVPKYKSHEKILKPEDMDGTMVDKKTGVIWKGKPGEDYLTTKGAYKLYVGQMVGDIPYAGFKPDKLNRRGIIDLRSELLAEKGFAPLPTWVPIPEHEHLKSGEVVLTTYKVNVQSQSRSQNCQYLTEIWHKNFADINPVTAAKFGVKSGDRVVIASQIGEIEIEARVREGVVPGVVAVSNHCGHWAYGRFATGGKMKAPFARDDNPDLKKIWWTDIGAHPNWVIPNSPDPIAGEERWMDTVVTIRKV